jgi:putative transposase
MKNRKRNRMQGFDYSSDNLYFVTICVQDRICCFGSVGTGRDLSVHHSNGNHSNGNHSNGNHSNGNHSNGNHSNGNHSNGNHSNKNHYNKNHSNENHSNGNHSNENYSNGNHSNGNHSNGNHSNGNHSNGNHSNGNHSNENQFNENQVENNCADIKMDLNEFGKIVKQQIEWLAEQYKYVEIHNYVVMPNHVHIIIEINRNKLIEGTARELSTEDQEIKIKSLSGLMGAFKTTSSKWIHRAGFEGFSWQRSFHDHIIRNDKSYHNISNYIDLNPEKWIADTFFVNR